MKPIRKAVFPVAGLGTRFLPATKAMPKEMLPLGLGHAVWCARELVGNEPFALLLPDVLVQHKPGCLTQMIHAARDLEAANIIAVEQVPPARVHMYGVVGVGKRRGDLFALTQMVEKPSRETAPSNLIITGRYVLQPEIFDVLAAEKRGAGDEIQLTDAMIELAKTQPFYGFEFQGRSFDCGSKVGFLAANIAYALEREDIAPAVRSELERLLGGQ